MVGTSTERSNSSTLRRHSGSAGPFEIEIVVGVERRLVDYLDALVEQRGVHVLDLLGSEVELSEHLGDVLGRHETPATPELDR